jgi:hypothetical protein
MDFSHQTITEEVRTFSTVGREVQVTFTLAAAIYRLPVEHKDFVQQVANLAAAWKSEKLATVVVRGVEIVSVASPESRPEG